MSDAPNRYPLPPILTGAVAVVALLLQFVAPISWEGSTFWIVLGVLLLLGGVALMAWAIVTMNRAQANVMPHRAATQLVTHGPFAWSRNPIYVADVMIVAGLGLAFRNAWMLIGAVVLAILLRELAAKREERHLAERFGDGWNDYSARVRRWV